MTTKALNSINGRLKSTPVIAKCTDVEAVLKCTYIYLSGGGKTEVPSM